MKDSKESELTFDDILDGVGNDGPFQRKFNIIFNFFLVICATMPYFNFVIALATPEHWCKVPGRESTNYTEEEWKMLTIPKEYNNGKLSYSKCTMFNTSQLINWNETDLVPRNSTNLELLDCQHGWEYDKTWYRHTTVTQEDWVCEKELYVTNTFAVCRIGELIGSFVAGQLGDTIGRKPVFLLSVVALTFGKLASIFVAQIYPLFLVTVIIGSFTSTSVYVSPLIIAMEISKDSDRAYIAMLQCIGWTIGLAFMPFIMWGIGHWVYFMIITTVPNLFFLFFYRMMVESPRWLITKGKTSKCIRELKRIAKANDRILTEDAILGLNIIARDTEKVYGVMSLFTHWRIAKNTTCIVICWIVTALSYMILILNTSNLGGNPFLNYFYQGLAEFPGYIIGKYGSNYFGRRWTHIGAFIGTALGCLPVAILAKDPDFQWLATALAVFLKFSISFAFYAVNLHSLEIYPTCLRQTGMALGAVLANAFGILGPYVVYLGTSVDARYPYIVLILMAILAAGCGFVLPETLNYKLPQTVAEAQRFGTDQKYFSIPQKDEEFEPMESDLSNPNKSDIFRLE